MLLLIEDVQNLVLFLRHLVHSVFIPLLRTVLLKHSLRDAYDAVAKCDGQLAQSNGHVYAHENADKASAFIDDGTTRLAQV